MTCAIPSAFVIPRALTFPMEATEESAQRVSDETWNRSLGAENAPRDNMLSELAHVIPKEPVVMLKK